MNIQIIVKKILGGGKEYLIDKIVEYRSYKYSKLSPDQYPQELKKIYRQQTGKELQLDSPQTYNEKVQWMKLYDNSSLKTRLSDKYLMKEYVAEVAGERYVVKLLGAWDKSSEIDFAKLPERFVLKTNHSCHTNIIVEDKKKLNIGRAKKKLNAWLKVNAEFMNGFEMQYKDIPRKIIAEEFIEGGETGLDDYKVWCFEGKPYYVQHLSDRKVGLHMEFYDTSWNKMPFVYSYPLNRENTPRPVCLDEMLQVAEKLAKGFHHVRVDFYLLKDGSLKVGELTFTSAGGTCLWNPEEWDVKLGELIQLPME